MAQSKRKRRLEARNKDASRKILIIVAVATVVFMFLLFLLFQNA